MESTIKAPNHIPPQHQDQQPGIEKKMHPRPVYDNDEPGCGKLKDKVAIITGGDSGIGRSVAIFFAKEGADVVIAYMNEHEDAKETVAAIKKYGKDALLISTDISEEENCRKIVGQAMDKFGRIDILVNNAAVQYQRENIEDISAEQLDRTFRVNIYSHFFLCKHASPYLKEGGAIINTASITAYRGHETLMDYASTKGAIVSFTRSLSQSLIKKGIRVNAVAPGPVWTPLIPASFDKEKVGEFGKDAPIGRPAQPAEIAPCYVFLASKDAAFITGQVIHPNGGTVLNT